MLPQDRLSGCGERVTPVGTFEIRTKFLRLRKAPRLGDRMDGWRVCWLGGWDRGRIFFVVRWNGNTGSKPPSRARRREPGALH